MNTSIESINETRKAITVTVPTDLIKTEEDKVLKEAVQKVQIPGFRRGKVPVHILKTKYGKELEADVRQKVIDAAFKHLIDDSKINPYALIKVDIQGDKIVANQDAVLTFLIDINPSFELPQYEGIEITIPGIEASEKEIQEAIQTILKEYADYAVTDQAAQEGDYVKVSYEGKIGDQTIADLLPRKTIYGTQKSTWEQAGAKNVPGVSAVIEGIIGMKAGDHKTVTMHFPEDFQIKELAGQDATYDVTVEEVRKLILPELVEGLFKKIGCESEDDLKAQVRKGILRHKTEASQGIVKNKIMDYLINNISFPISETAIKDEEEALLRLFMTRMMRHGLNEQEIEAKRDELINVAEKEANFHAKGNIILEAIAKKENIELSTQDLNAAVMHEARQADMKPEQFVKLLKNDRKLVQHIRGKALYNKVLDFLYKKSKVTYEGNIENQS